MKKVIYCSCIALLFTHCVFAEEGIRLQEGLPIMVDCKTQLNDIYLQNGQVTYIYELINVPFQEAVRHLEQSKEKIEKNACQDELIQDLFAQDLDIKFVYKIKTKQILEVCISKDHCQNHYSVNEFLKPSRKNEMNHLLSLVNYQISSSGENKDAHTKRAWS